MDIEGIIIRECGIKSGTSDRGDWRVAEYVIETIEQYPRRMCFSVKDSNDGKIERLDIRTGKRMRVWFSIDAKEFQGQRGPVWYNQIRAYDAREVRD